MGVNDIRDYFQLLIFLSSNFFWQGLPIGDPKMRSSSSVFVFILGHVFRKCVKIELYCVPVVGLKKQISHFSVFKLRP